MMLGTFVHQRILEPDLPLPSLAVKPEGMKFVTREGKAWKEAQEAAGRLIIKQDEYDTLIGCVDSIRANEACREIFAAGQSEVSLFKRHPRTGLLCKARVDWLPDPETRLENNLIIVDIKTTRGATFTTRGGAHPEEFADTLYRSRYYVQSAYYLDLWNGLMGETNERETFVFIVVEKTPPYLVALYYVDLDDIDLGRERYEMDLTVLAECQKEKLWPGYPVDPVKISLPAWARRKERAE
jgi:hypothetical protein